MFGFYDSSSWGRTIIFLRREGAGQFPKNIPAQQKPLKKKTSCKGSHGTKNRTSAFGFAALIFDVEKVLAQAIVTQNYHVQPKRSEKKNITPYKIAHISPSKKWFVFCHVAIMKGYSQFASEFGRPDGVEWIVQLIASGIKKNTTYLNTCT